MSRSVVNPQFLVLVQRPGKRGDPCRTGGRSKLNVDKAQVRRAIRQSAHGARQLTDPVSPWLPLSRLFYQRLPSR